MGMADNGGLSVADALALQNKGGNDFFGGNGMWVFFLFFLLAWSNGGIFGNKGGGNSAMEAVLSNGLNQQDLFRNQAGIMQEIGAFERDATNNWGNMKYDNLMGVNSIIAALNEFRAEASKCCCETNRNIDALRYENAKNTCDIINAQKDGVQRVVDHMTQYKMQELRDDAQITKIVNKLHPCPIPAYPSCSPYQSFPQGCGY